MNSGGSVFAYVIDQADGLAVKIGVARDIGLRLKAVQNGNPRRLRVHFSLRFSDGVQAAKAERRAHAILRDQRLSGEWFSCTAAQAKDALKRAAADMATTAGPAKPFWRGRKVKA